MDTFSSGDLVIVTYMEENGIGYIYDNGSGDKTWLAIGISWEKGGSSNTSVEDALESGAKFEKCIITKLTN